MTPETNKLPTPISGVLLNLGGQEYRLRFSLRDRRRFREEVGKDVLSADVMGDLLAKLLSYGLRPRLTEEEVEDLVDLEHIAEVVEAVTQATGAAALLKMFPEAVTHELMEVGDPPPAPTPDPQAPTPEPDVGQTEVSKPNDDSVKKTET